ncbi:adenosylmethionine--8-amino-7-oxononanoate transaminase [Candidatus Nitrosotenuis aquarius]|uniref:adenosylmethionine--8-amino-7-oxononanoate transaminase n=1 Tax=Candidatus Nitrosotenuis aquarius TaxID=1846278 RepID=UPI000C1EE82E|nr:adenosylmethionine--8-amino-7-oxononanoate transaminase [Candidatus Nitrosotenuis aquarius]
MRPSSVWHPYTQMSEWDSFPNIVRGDGFWLIDSDGNRYLDGVASMWCNVWGHSKKELVSAISKQAKKITHSSLFNLTNNQAENLAEKLIAISPGMNRVFYSDNGSTAMEIAFKIAIQYWQNIGYKNKNMFATLQNGYHGDTFGTMSVGFVPAFFAKFKKNLYKTIQIPFENSYKIANIEEYYSQTLEKIEVTLAKNQNIAAFVMESGAQIAGGVNIYQNDFQSQISKICRKYNTLLILDEIATGFGRLGSLVEYTAQKSKPDIVTYGKMLTAGYLPMAATLVTKKIYDSFLGKYHQMKHLYHGHTFTGNTLACAVANQNLDLYQKTNLITNVRKTASHLKGRLEEFYDIHTVGDIRHKGILVAIELVSDRAKKTPMSFAKSTNKIVFEEAKKHKIYLRTLGNIVMLVPPLAMPQKEIDFLIDGTIKTIKNISK